MFGKGKNPGRFLISGLETGERLASAQETHVADGGIVARCDWTGESLVMSRIPSNVRISKAMFE